MRNGLVYFFALMIAGAIAIGLAGNRAEAQSPTRAFPVRASALGSTKTALNGSGATLDTIHCVNLGVAPAYLQLFNAAVGNVTVGTTTPTLSLGMAVSGTIQLAGTGWWFSTAVTGAGTTTATGSSSATIDCNFGFK